MKKNLLFVAAGACMMLLTTLASHAGEVNNFEILAMAVDTAEYENQSTIPALAAEHYKEINQALRYPQKAIELGIEGEVLVLCKVNTEGQVTDVSVLKDIGGDCGKEAVRIVSRMKFQPAVQNGYAVPYNMVIPVLFDLESI